MRKNSNIFWLLLLLFNLGCAIKKEKFIEASNVQKFILENGLTVVAKKIKGNPLVSIEILIKTGSARENEYLGTGISHFLEHLIFKGTEKFPPGEIARYINRLGGEINGITTFDYTSFFITVPKENWEEALYVLVDSVFNPKLSQDDFMKERQVIINEMIMNENDPQRKIFHLFFHNFYRIHPYRHPIIGYKDLFLKLTIEDIKNYHRKTYIPNNAILAISGDFDENLFLEKTKIIFSEIERGKEIENIKINEPFRLFPHYYEEKFPTKLMYLLLGFPGIEVNHQDLYALDLLATILGEGNSSRLYTQLRERKNLIYSVSCFNYTLKEEGFFGIFITGEDKDRYKVIEEIKKEIEKIKRFSVSSREFNKAKNILLKQFYFDHEKVESQTHNIATGEFFAQEPEFYSLYMERIKKLDKKELQKVAQKYFDFEKMVVVCLRPEENREKKEGVNERIKVDEEVEKVELENGLTILLKENHNLPIVSINMVFLGGLRLENRENNGISNLCANLILKRNEKIVHLLEELGGSLNVFSGNNSLGISLNIISKNIDSGIHLLSEIIKKTKFSKEDLEKEKLQIIAKIKKIEDNPVQYALKLIKKELFLKHPYGMDVLGEIETIEKIDLDEIYNFYKKIINPNNCVISLFGSFKKESVIKEIKKNFSFWKKGENMLFLNIEKEPPLEKPRICIKDTPKTQAVVAVGFHTVPLYDPKSYSFLVLENILGGQGNRLFENIREKLGLVYFVDVYHMIGIEPGYFIFLAGTEKDNLEKVTELIFEEIKKLKELDISEEEINRAKAYLLGKRRRDLQTNEGFSLLCSLEELYGLGFDNYKDYEKKINSVSLDDLKNIIQSYFQENNYALVKIVPQ